MKSDSIILDCCIIISKGCSIGPGLIRRVGGLSLTMFKASYNHPVFCSHLGRLPLLQFDNDDRGCAIIIYSRNNEIYPFRCEWYLIFDRYTAILRYGRITKNPIHILQRVIPGSYLIGGRMPSQVSEESVFNLIYKNPIEDIL